MLENDLGACMHALDTKRVSSFGGSGVIAEECAAGSRLLAKLTSALSRDVMTTPRRRSTAWSVIEASGRGSSR